ncbi:polysaccharide biosynthesis protein [Caenispirillum salinarum]|uniref:polysaccharide biosynthesis protein n=1 Tax=Caenispirillum salinarum TaxID=859058 RepID=UPI00384C8DE8
MQLTRIAFRRVGLVFVHDVIMAGLSFVLALFLRLDWAMFAYLPPMEMAQWTLLFAVVAAAAFHSQGMYRGVWRYASLRDLAAILRGVTLTLLIFLPLMFLATRLEPLPRSALIINWFVLLFLVGAPRFAYRLFKDGTVRLWRNSTRRMPVLLVGAGDLADLFIREMNHADAIYEPVGILGWRTGRIGREINGVRVLGTTKNVDSVVDGLASKGLRPQRVLIAQDKSSREDMAELFDTCERLQIRLERLPSMTEFKQGLVDRLEVRPIAIEDLLGRPQAVLDRDSMRDMIRGRRVMITGAGGSIGSELTRQVSGFEPASLMIVDSSEFALYTIDMEINERFGGVDRKARIADVRDRARIRNLMDTFRPELVFHAAALKHVPLVEANPAEGLMTNAIGTRIMADACVDFGVAMMVLISTDKAVNPTNIMGASKRIAERYCQSLDIRERARPGGTQFITVRFGNVLGSTGSVVPLFRRQLEAGGPLTVTHPDMTRYFMTIREAVELVLQASAHGLAEQIYRGRIFVLDMGEPVKIVDLATQMIRLAGLRPQQDVKIVFTGLRPGEKLFEEIFHGAEPPVPTAAPGILVANSRAEDPVELQHSLTFLEEACRLDNPTQTLEHIRRLVPEYSPTVIAA